MPLAKSVIYSDECYKIVGVCMQVHKHLGRGGFSEIVIKDALQHEFKLQQVSYEREVGFDVEYKGVVLPHKFFADFVVMDKIILEIKNCAMLTDNHIAQSLNYLAISKLKLAVLVNFGDSLLEYKRLVL
jgi:GxxExxY protein